MAREPEFGVPLTADDISLGLPIYPMYGVTPSNEYIPVKVDGTGTLAVSATFSGSITIGEIGLDDRSGFTYGASLEQPIGGVFQDSGASLSSGQTGAVRLTQFRGLHTNLRDAAGNQLLGQELSADSLPVVIASDQSAIPVSISGTIPVSGTVAATQSGTWTVNLASESIEIGSVDQGIPNTLTNGWPVKLTDGTNVLGTSANPVRTDPTGTTTQPISGSVSISNFPATQPISGSVSISNFPATQPISGTVSISGSVAVTGTFFQAVQPISGTIAVSNFPATQPISGSVSISNFPAVQPISGTITANAGSGTFQTNITNSTLAVTQSGTWSTEMQDGSGTPLTSTLVSGKQALDVNIAGGVTLDVNLSHTNDSILVYGNDGTTDQKIRTDGSGNTQVGIAGIATAAITSVAASVTSVPLLALNANRKMVTIYNDSTSEMFLALGSAASTTNFTVRLKTNDYYELPLPIYLGSVNAVWDTATGNARITELS